MEARRIDCVVVYKVDRLSRSLLDFTRLLSLFGKRAVSFVSVTQEFKTPIPTAEPNISVELSPVNSNGSHFLVSHPMLTWSRAKS